MKFPVFDSHCDTAFELLRRHEMLYSNNLHVSLEQAQKLDGYVQVFALWTAAARRQNQSQYDLLQQMYDNLQIQFALFPERVRQCRTAAEVRQTVDEGLTAAIVSIEGAEGVNCDPGLLDAAWDTGVRMVSLTWNHENELAGPHGTDRGLTAQGRDFVRRAQRLGMVIDVSHLSDRGFRDLCDITEGPIVASHSNARAVCGHSRNLTDDMFREIVRSGGVAGINLYTAFLTERERCTLDDVLRHMDHFLGMDGGSHHLALGGDMDGCEHLPEPMTGVAGYAALIDAMQKHGIPEQTIADICFNNHMEVMKRCNM